jgi:hypothetical protein
MHVPCCGSWKGFEIFKLLISLEADKALEFTPKSVNLESNFMHLDLL